MASWLKYIPIKHAMVWLVVIYLVCCLFVWILPITLHNLAFQPPKKTAYKDRSFFIHNSLGSGNRIAAIYYSQKAAKYTILYSHGNAEDMSQISEYLREFSQKLNVNVILYDYSGYGLSDGSPSEQEFYNNIEMVYGYLTDSLNIKSENIILYGVSIGSGPTTYLASKYHDQIGGMILQSPFKSVATVIIPQLIIDMLAQITFKQVNSIDMFRNIDYIENIIDMPVLIIHGTHDRLISISNGKALHDRLKDINKNNVSNCWVEYCGHNDIEWYKGKELRDKIKQFIDYDVDKQPFFVKLDNL